jgi:hypothetical protein
VLTGSFDCLLLSQSLFRGLLTLSFADGIIVQVSAMRQLFVAPYQVRSFEGVVALR